MTPWLESLTEGGIRAESDEPQASRAVALESTRFITVAEWDSSPLAVSPWRTAACPRHYPLNPGMGFEPSRNEPRGEVRGGPRNHPL